MNFVRRLIHRIPDSNRIVLKKVLMLLQLYASHSGKNRMTESNLAVVFAPALWRERKVVDELRAVQEVSVFVELTAFLINKHAELLA